MEFFYWLSIPQLILDWFQNISENATPEDVAYIALRNSYINIGIAGVLFLLGLIFGGIALRAMAKKEGLKPSFLAFVPFANTWYAGKIAGEANFFGQKMKRAGLYAMILEILYVAMETLLVVVSILATKPEYFVFSSSYWKVEAALLPQWQCILIHYGRYISLVLEIFLVVLLVVLFMALFRKYYARGPVLMTILCTILPFRGFTLFAVRKNTPVDYNAYMRRRAEEYARRHNPYGYGGYPGGYPQGGAKGQGPTDPFGGSGGSGSDASDPFGEFGDSGGSGASDPQNDNPFEDFK